MIPKFYCGIDISKETLDLAVLHDGDLIFSQKIENSQKAVQDVLLKLKASFNVERRNAFFCAEQMGIYASNLLAVVKKKKLVICMESPLRIRLSMGIQRGKNDRLDAVKIAKYAVAFLKQLKIWQPPRAVILQLKYMFAVRKRLVKLKVALINPAKVETYYLPLKDQKANQQLFLNSKLAIEKDIKNVEERMFTLIKGDPRLSHLFFILTSIPQIGKMIALNMIVTTNEFLSISTAKEFASYCGIAPFEWLSGKSIKGRTRVSHIANKDLKVMLHLAAMGSVRHKGSTLEKYYSRKVSEGKNKMSVLNAIRNKLVHFMYACIERNECYKI